MRTRGGKMRTGGARAAAGFTLVEVLVALMVVAIGLAALMVAVSGTARTSGMLRDKTLAEWIALNRLAEVRLNLTKYGQNTDAAELDYANRKWHYDTRYFDTSVNGMKRVVVRVYAGDAKTKGNPLIETVGFALAGTQLSPPGSSNTADWTLTNGPRGAAASAGAGTATPGTQVTSPGVNTGIGGTSGASTGGASGGAGTTGLGAGITGQNTNSPTNP